MDIGVRCGAAGLRPVCWGAEGVGRALLVLCRSRCYFVGRLLYVGVGGVCMSKEIIGGEEIFDFLLVRAVVGDDRHFVFVSMYSSGVVLTSLVM